MKLAILSDAHAFMEGNDKRRSHQSLSSSGALGRSTPLFDLRQLISENPDIRADVLVLPGDLCDQADPDAFRAVWSLSEEFGTALGASLVVGSAGNHDLQSRPGQAEYDPLEAVKSVRPYFPCHNELSANEFWSRHYTILRQEDTRIVLLNSSAYHTNKEELERGRVAKGTVEALADKLRSCESARHNVLVCHHHPQQHMELGLGEDDVIKGGQLLLDALGKGDIGAWLVVHGHKHHGKLTYAAGGANAPVVLSCGSTGIITKGNISNQFHIVELGDDAPRFGARGSVLSWDWSLESQWTSASSASGLPHRCGFGFRGDLEELANQVANAVADPYSTWAEIAAVVPDLERIIPGDFALLRSLLTEQYSVSMLEEFGAVAQLHRQERSAQ